MEIASWKDMARKDVEDLVKSLTDEHFEIIEFEEDKDTGEVKVIIKFTDTESSKDFVRNVNNYARDNPNIIKRVKGVVKKDASYAEHNASCFWHTLLTALCCCFNVMASSFKNKIRKKQAPTNDKQ